MQAVCVRVYFVSLQSSLEYKRLHCRELVPTDRLSCVRTFTRLFDALAVPENGVAPEDGQEAFTTMVEVSVHHTRMALHAHTHWVSCWAWFWYSSRVCMQCQALVKVQELQRR